MQVWITRTDSSAQKSAAAIERAGYLPLIAPLLKLTPASTPDAAPAPGSALAFTSANGVRAFAALTDRRDWQVFAVGEATADMASRAGFVDIQIGGGDVDALSTLIIEVNPVNVVHLSGVHVAGDLVGDLQAQGIYAQRTIIYATRAVEELPETAVEALASGAPLAVFLYSPKGAQTFLTLMRKAEQKPAFGRLKVISISDGVDAVLADERFARRLIAKSPDEGAMIAALEIAAPSA